MGSNHLSDFFQFNRNERNGILVLAAILLSLIVVYFLLPFLVSKQPIDINASKAEIDRFWQSHMQEEAKKNPADSSTFQQAERFSFNPNNTSSEDWRALGLSDKQISTIKNYLSKGGQFRNASDLKKIYGISDDLYKELEPYIYIEGIKSEKESFCKVEFSANSIDAKTLENYGLSGQMAKRYVSYREKINGYHSIDQIKSIYGMTDSILLCIEPFIVFDTITETIAEEIINPVELNSADLETLKSVKGIGDYYANAIIKYRDLLGGYINIDQLQEIYNMKKETYESIRTKLVVDSNKVNKIDINSCDEDSLGRHPYIEYKYAREIVKYRKKKGKFESVEDILLLYLIPQKDYKCIQRYLECKK